MPSVRFEASGVNDKYDSADDSDLFLSEEEAKKALLRRQSMLSRKLKRASQVIGVVLDTEEDQLRELRPLRRWMKILEYVLRFCLVLNFLRAAPVISLQAYPMLIFVLMWAIVLYVGHNGIRPVWRTGYLYAFIVGAIVSAASDVIACYIAYERSYSHWSKQLSTTKWTYIIYIIALSVLILCGAFCCYLAFRMLRFAKLHPTKSKLILAKRRFSRAERSELRAHRRRKRAKQVGKNAVQTRAVWHGSLMPTPESRDPYAVPPSSWFSFLPCFSPSSYSASLDADNGDVFSSNVVTKTQYTILNFVPKFLMFQFGRLANMYTLCIVILSSFDFSPVSPTSSLFPLLIVVCAAAIKEITEDRKRWAMDSMVNSRPTQLVRARKEATRGSAQVRVRDATWSHVEVGDILRVNRDEFFPADLLLLGTSDGVTMHRECNIGTMNLDGETNLKKKMALDATKELDVLAARPLNMYLECEKPNPNLYRFDGTLSVYNSDRASWSRHRVVNDNIVLRATQLKNTEFIYGLVVNTGADTKVEQNATEAPLKRSSVEGRVNHMLVWLLFIQIFICTLCALGENNFKELDPNEQISVGFKLPWYLSGNEGKQSLRDNSFLTYIILYNTLIPLSLYVSLEVVRFGNSKQVNNDETMADAEADIKPNCRNTNIMEELGQVRYVFTDKTGTLTRNEMKLVRAVVAGRSYDVGDVGAYRTDLCNDELLRDFTLNMALCNTVLPCAPRDAGADADAGAEGKGLESKHSQGAREYQAESPDEQTLVETCAVLGCSMTHRDQKTITLGVSPGTQWVAAKDGGESFGGNGGSQLVYEILLVLPFDSVRKRMSVVVRAPDGQVVVFCKGADASMHWVLSDASEEQDWSAADLALGSMAGAGLRTLVMAHKRMDAGEFAEVEEAHQQALDELDPEKHLALMQRVSELVECELTLSGVSGIEDKLQDKVPECIAALRSAGISVWVLTGDKQETAISIGYTSQALSKDCDLLIFNERVPVDLAQSMQAHCTRFGLNVSTLDQESEMQGALQTPVSIVIDGPTLSIVLAEPGTKAYHPLIGSMFLSLAKMSGSVVCCRCTPLQKSSIVRLVAERSTLVGDGAVTLAIGDGANDVSMIQEAHVGVGISGKEGMQCVLAADFSLPNFKGIRPLLLVHGYQIYRRISKVILYSFCKNFALAFVAFWFSFYNKFSGQLVFFDLSFTLYNALFTALPILAVGLGDEDVARWVLGHTDEGMKLYSNGLNHMALNTRSFFGWVCLGIWHSFIIFVVGFFFVGEVLPNGQNLGLWELGLACFTYLVFNMSAQILLLARRWTKALKLTVFLSVFNFWWFALAYCSATYVPVLENLTTSNAHWSIYMIAQAPRYWFGIVFCIVLGVLPNYIVKSVSIFFGGRQSYDVASIERRYKTDEAHEYFMLNDAGESMPGAADMGAGDDKDFRMNTLDRRYRRESSSGPKGYWCP